ncbi:MAG: UDP-N-acetylglucosamine 1-carboxyvinyltransferase [Candidatus Levybacteria bacterium]|nr:UDP-N-acetylglucosamine 1-carboxyvinyltransferase [Candidatus Levybacteria bacterium]
MAKIIVKGGRKLKGNIKVSGAKNVALKALVAACLTDEEVIIHNVPLISDFKVMVAIIAELGGKVKIKGHTAYVQMKNFTKEKISLDEAAKIRTSAMFLAPLLSRVGKAVIPNPGGCRIGARPIDRTVRGLEAMGFEAFYNSSDGFFYFKKKEGKKKLIKDITYRFEKTTHTGTETLILAAVLRDGKTVLENAAREPEIDELISLLIKMGAKIKKVGERRIEIVGVKRLHGAEFSIGFDRNEIVTLATAAILTKGDIFIEGADTVELSIFLDKLKEVGGGVEAKEGGIRFYYKGPLRGIDVQTSSYPGFMTDWQGPWAVLMLHTHGSAIIHETVYENRFGYVQELKKMGANIILFNPSVKNPEEVYNFNLSDNNASYFHAIEVKGPAVLHDAVVKVSDLRAGATLVLAALAAKGETVIFGIEHLDRGYENLEKGLESLGANIKRVKEE